jgi:hypothetical protein
VFINNYNKLIFWIDSHASFAIFASVGRVVAAQSGSSLLGADLKIELADLISNLYIAPKRFSLVRKLRCSHGQELFFFFNSEFSVLTSDCKCAKLVNLKVSFASLA